MVYGYRDYYSSLFYKYIFGNVKRNDFLLVSKIQCIIQNRCTTYFSTKYLSLTKNTNVEGAQRYKFITRSRHKSSLNSFSHEGTVQKLYKSTYLPNLIHTIEWYDVVHAKKWKNIKIRK